MQEDQNRGTCKHLTVYWYYQRYCPEEPWFFRICSNIMLLFGRDAPPLFSGDAPPVFGGGNEIS